MSLYSQCSRSPKLKAWITVIRQDPCCYCGEPIRQDGPFRLHFSAEHVIPRSWGGKRYSIGNVVAAHRECNQRRGHKPLLVFLLELHRVRVSKLAPVPPSAVLALRLQNTCVKDAKPDCTKRASDVLSTSGRTRLEDRTSEDSHRHSLRNVRGHRSE